MNTRQQDLEKLDEGWRPMSPLNLTERFKAPSTLWAQNHPRPRTCLDGAAPGPAEDFQVLHEFFELQADVRPNDVAVMFGREATTYGELEARANRLARHLRSRGVQRGSLVAILVPRSADAYAALLGILKAGAAYVPLDPEYPADRVEYILENCAASALVTIAQLAGRHAGFGGAVIRVDADRDAIDAESSSRLPRGEIGVSPRDLCYVIYTSGSTGRPKGVMIEHRSACHLVGAEVRIFEVRPEDRVYQGFSLAFDASVEEVWLAFRAGATLVAATPEMAHAGPDLSRLLAESGVTVLSCVPTLLSMVAEDVPTVRLLIFGGETCPDQLVERWSRPGRRLVNTYGPTEATVIATYADLTPGKPVTIGRAVPGYRVYLLDDGMRQVPNGEIGELWIGGVGVARGYVGLPGSTEARFLPDPFAPQGETDARIYRTGDLGRINAGGNIEFLGRADSQVKLRGFRVELAEIESVMLQAPDVRAAACAVREDVPGVQQLVGYVVRSNGEVDEDRLRSLLRNRLPSYMVPGLIETVAELPRLPSGKLDRPALPPPRLRDTNSKPAARRPRTDTERRIAQVWENLFKSQSVSIDDEFFLDLGGHSLLAARMVSQLRSDPQYAHVSVGDLYEHPTIASLASALDAAPPRPQPQRKSVSPDRDASGSGERARHFLAGVLQSIGLYFVFGLRGAQWFAPYLVYFFLELSGHPFLESAAWAAVSVVGIYPVGLGIAVAAKWLVLGRVRPGRYPLWGWYYVRWWFAQTMVQSAPIGALTATPLLPWFYRLLGARIGRDVHIGTMDLAAFDVISIGDGSTIDDGSMLLGYAVEGGELVIGSVRVGSGCFVGTRSVVGVGATMEDGARLEDLSLLPAGGRIPKGETWAGSPARRGPSPKAVRQPPPARSPLKRAAIAALYASLIPIISVALLTALVPGLALLTLLNPLAKPLLYLLAAPVVGASFVLCLTLEVVALKWLFVGRVRAGTYPLHGSFYIRNWVVDHLLMLILGVVGGLHATLYLSPWYRALGAKIGRFVELSTATSTIPDLLEIGDESTIADEVSLGASRIEGGWMTMASTRLGRRTFLGNGAVLNGGTVMGENSLVGVLSLAPTNPSESTRSGASWLGSPPILLPRREPSAGFIEGRTYRPPRWLWLTRAAIEIVRVTLPPAGFVMVTTTVVRVALQLAEFVGLGATLLLQPLVYMACCGFVAAAVALAKWVFSGRFRAFVKPLWSPFVWRLEAVTALYEFLLTPLALEPLRGTPFLVWYLRLLGAKIGRGVYIHTTGLIEFDLVEVGDRAAINDEAVLQSHLFEDRMLKASGLRVGADCTVGAGSVVLYDAEMEDGSRLDALSLLMKGERLPAGTSWAGSPAAWVTTPHPRPTAPAQESWNRVEPEVKQAASLELLTR
jgi:non-ribosomal peptide synthetase-like protein